MPFLEKASGTGFQGPRYRRSIGEQFLSYLEAWKRLAGGGGWRRWAGQTPGQPSQPVARVSAAIRPLSEPPPLAPGLILPCLPLPRKSPPLPGETPLLCSPPPPPAEVLEGALAGIWKVWKTLADFFPSGRPPHYLTP